MNPQYLPPQQLGGPYNRGSQSPQNMPDQNMYQKPPHLGPPPSGTAAHSDNSNRGSPFANNAPPQKTQFVPSQLPPRPEGNILLPQEPNANQQRLPELARAQTNDGSINHSDQFGNKFSNTSQQLNNNVAENSSNRMPPPMNRSVEPSSPGRPPTENPKPQLNPGEPSLGKPSFNQSTGSAPVRMQAGGTMPPGARPPIPQNQLPGSQQYPPQNMQNQPQMPPSTQQQPPFMPPTSQIPQLSNQMQSMSLSGPKQQMVGPPMKNMVNGDYSPGPNVPQMNQQYPPQGMQNQPQMPPGMQQPSPFMPPTPQSASNIPPNQSNQPPHMSPYSQPQHLPPQMNQPSGMPQQMNQPPGMPQQMNQPPGMPQPMNQPLGMPQQMNQPLGMPQQMNQPPGMPQQMNQPPGMPQQMNQPPGMPQQMNQPPGMPHQMNQPSNLPQQMSQPPHMPPTMNQRPGMPQPMSQPPYMPPTGYNQPLLTQPSQMGQMPHMPPPLNKQGYTNGQQIPPVRSPQMPGYQPGGLQGQMPSGPYPSAGYEQPQQKRLDPDHMPNPIQVTEDDQANRSGVFVTNQKGLVPPLVTTNFVVQDQGNCSPRLMRSTMYNIPVAQDMMKQTAIPFSLIISPMARTVDQEYPPPIVNFGELGPVRCVRCKAYMCPYMQFVDAGRRFQCLFCKATSDVPAEYFQHLDHTGQRMDKYERPELVLGTYEFVATADYCRNNVLPKPPAIIFVIDVSYNNVKSGLVHLLCSEMKQIIQNLPVDQGQEKSNMKVGFITYNNSVHFYNIKGTLAAPQMLVVGDTQEMFMPLLDGFLCTPEESESVIDALMEQIPTMFADTRETEVVLLPAILAGLEALKASECTGKLMVFHSSLPSAEAPGKLKNRDDRKVLGTDKEKTVLIPQTQAYSQLGQDCVAAGCSVDLFIFNNSYIDIATIGQVARLSGGEVFKYTYFQADIDGDRLIKDVIMDISRPIAFDAVMRVRTSTGIRPTDFYGHFFMSNTTDIELAAVDCDKAIAVEIKHDDKLSEDEGVYIQTALLYTSCSGQRRLRIINLSLKTCSQMADLFRSCDLDTMINYISKQAVYKLLDNNPKAVKDAIVNRAAQILAMYRKNCSSPSSSGQLILPECMKLLPLYINCLLKSDALSGGSDMSVDDKSFAMQAVMTMDVGTSVNYFYPRLIPIHNINPQEDVEIPKPIRCTIEKMSEQGVYILENGIHMFLWIGLGASPEFVQNVFGAPSAIQIDIERPGLPELDNPLSIAVRQIIENIRIQRHRCMRLTLVRQREKLEAVFKHFLVEDRGLDGSPSYVDFLCHMHKEIRMLLS